MPRGFCRVIETGLYYLQSRYYDPKIGRFINADSYASTGQGFLGLNMFAYCRNNPVSRIDISGAYDVECGHENPLNDEDLNNDSAPGGGKNSTSTETSNGGYSYTAPRGGGGVSSSVKVGNITVTFGHGGRHPDYADISGLENAIAHDVVTKPPTTGYRGEYNIIYNNIEFTYRCWTISSERINVGTYFMKY